MAVMLFASLRNGALAPKNPWASAGYEWWTTTPPHPHNFEEAPVMHRGPYDYHLCTEEELFEGFPEKPGDVAHSNDSGVAVERP